MGGTSSATSAAMPSAGGGFGSQAAMQAGTIAGTTGTNMSGMGWVPKATTASPYNSSAAWGIVGNSFKNAAGSFSDALGRQTFNAPQSSASYFPEASASPSYDPAILPSYDSPFLQLSSKMAAKVPSSRTPILADTAKMTSGPRPRTAGFSISNLYGASPYM